MTNLSPLYLTSWSQNERNESTKVTISDETKALIHRLLLERISLAGIAGVTQVSEKLLQDYVNQKYAQIPRQVKVSVKKKVS